MLKIRTKLFLIIALLCAVAQGAWATDYTVSNETELRDAIEDNANITLTQNIDISKAITVGNGQTVTIDLGGFTLNRGCTSRDSQVIGVFSGSTLYLSNGTVTGGWGGGGGAMFNEGTMHLTSVTISGNTADDRGGGLSNNGTLTMTGCTVKNNTSNDNVSPAGGGGIFNYSGKTATLTNCTITGNKASTYGGGGICNYGTMTLENCSVKNNNANTTGGGIFCSTTSTLSINGCDITGNSAVSYGDGIYIDNSTINMQGLCTVTGNTDSNIYLYGSGTVITVTGAFTSGSDIGVGFSDYGRKFTSGYSTYNDGTDPGDFFTSDNGYYAIGKKDGEVYPGITYWDHSWEGGDTDGHVVNTRKVCTDYSEYNGETSLSNGWYVLTGTHTYNDRLACHGDVKFILVDGSDTEFKKGIHIDNPKLLTIYGQDNGTGKLRCTGDGGSASNGDAAIGGNNEVVGGHLIIHGGTIEAEPNHNNAAGIGGGDGASGMQSVTIWDGKIEAKGHSSGAGIGAGKDNSVIPTVTIYGGNINTESASKGAGIGGGEGSSNNTIIIFGGNITAKGGSKGSGIGSGYKGDVDNPITIYGGTITATGGSEAAGIGAGSGANISGGTNYGHQNEKITIYGATVTAKGGKEAAGIGAGKIGKGGTIDITNSTVYATGGESGSGIGGGIHTTSASGSGNAGTVTIKNSYVEAIGVSAIGGGRGGNGGSVNIDNSSTVKVQCTDANGDGGSYEDNAFIGSGGSVSSEEGLDGNLSLGTNLKVSLDGSTKSSGQRRSTCQSHPDDYDMVVTIEPCDHSGANYTIKNESKHKINCSYCEGVEENHDTDGESGSCSKCGYGGTGYTITFYEANEDGTGYSTTPITYTTGYQVSFTLPECTSVPNDKWAFVGWKALTGDAPTSLLADDSELSSLESAGKSFKVSENVTYYARYQVCWTGAGSGTSSDPYQIKTADDWNYIATKVSGGKINYSGKCFKMTDNISVTTQIGTYDDGSKYFGGNFNGDGHTLTFNISGSSQGMAPFGNVRSATIRNLVICGSIENSAKFASGLIGSMKSGTTTISNCRVNAIVSNTISGDGTSGGFVANIQGGTVNFTRCIFDGTLSGSTAKGWGGFVGWNAGGAKVNITNCLFKPDANSDVTDGNTFARCKTASDMTITNSYYTQSFGTAQGTQAYTVESYDSDKMWLYYGQLETDEEEEALEELEYRENEIFAFDTGLLYQKIFYTGGETAVTFTPLATEYGKMATDVTANSGTLTNNGDGSYTLTMASANSTVTATITDLSGITLYDGTHDPTNEETLEENEDKIMNVTISGRTLYKDGSWNTLCVPFDVSAEKISVHPLLQNCTIMELDTEGEYDGHQTGFDSVNGILYLYFKEVHKIDARKPYLIKWMTTGEPITSPTFFGSYIESSSPRTVTSDDGYVSFVGNYDPVNIGASGDNTKLYLGSGNTLYWPSGSRSINAFRAYFQLNDIEAGEPNSTDPNTPLVRAFVLNFGDDGETTGIVGVEHGILNIEHSAATGWYDLSGRKLQGKPTAKGIYIYKGKKVIK